MGYDLTIKVKYENLDSKFKCNYKNDVNINDYIHESKMDIISYCMKDHSEDSFTAVYKTLKFKIDYLIQSIEEDYKSFIEASIKDEGEIYFRGWQYAGDNCNEIDLDSLKKNTLETLLMLALNVKTPDYFDEHELFYEKYNNIDSALSFDDMVEDSIAHEFINMYKTKDENTEESY